MATITIENYLKALYTLNQVSSEISLTDLSKEMNVSAPTVNNMIKKLQDKGWVAYQKYKPIKLTKDGALQAATIIRKHRLWEVFLVKKLNFSWDEVHEVAEQLEHIKSEKLTQQLDAFLDHPTEDPHGDPIPDCEGNLPYAQKILLAQIERAESCICVGVKDSTSQFLQYLDKHNIALGTKIEVLSKESFDESMSINVKNHQLTISKEVAHNLFVKIS